MSANNSVAKKKPDKAVIYCSKFKGSITQALPEHITPKHYIRAFTTAVRKTPKLMECNMESVVNAVLKTAQLGLLPDVDGQCYFIPFKNECQLIIGYKGFEELAYRGGKVTNIRPVVVYENDKLEYIEGLNPVLNHTPQLVDRGKPYAVYAVAELQDSDPTFIVLTKDDVMAAKKASKASESGFSPWNGPFETEMWKKTAILRLCKHLPKSIELRQALDFEQKQQEKEVKATVVDAPADLRNLLDSSHRAIEPEEFNESEIISNPSGTATNIDEEAVSNSAPTEIEKLKKWVSDAILNVSGIDKVVEEFCQNINKDSYTRLTEKQLEKLKDKINTVINSSES